MYKAYIIHNPLRSDRLEVLKKEILEQNILDYELVPAIMDNKRGIAKSHKTIVRKAKELGLPAVLIMEDDVRFCGPGAFKYFLDNIPETYDLYLSGVYYGKLNDVNKVNKFSGLHCYLVHERFYDTFLSIKEEGNIDNNLTGAGYYKVCYPFAAVQHNGFSDNVHKEVNYDKYLSGRKFYNDFKL